MADTSPIVREIEQFCRRHRMAETTFGRLAANDGKLVRRLRSGGRMWPENEQRVRDFMQARDAPPTPHPDEAA
ncbi:hypothetical protein [Roseospira goensis]|uniref:Uncharacterized protein n=1 Tax=Roseospira goensis TaxID=391922 RepID=A0A7W6S374_9PROT|nr:hypothetical protein [Roseospira goensis]MBB4287921.1 hypothetical protein [Roseospira goensis]